jgi:hypothetical protein
MTHRMYELHIAPIGGTWPVPSILKDHDGHTLCHAGEFDPGFSTLPGVVAHMSPEILLNLTAEAAAGLDTRNDPLVQATLAGEAFCYHGFSTADAFRVSAYYNAHDAEMALEKLQQEKGITAYGVLLHFMGVAKGVIFDP